MGDTTISWTTSPDGTPGKTWNPIRGCSRVSEGCRNCYAESVAARFSDPGMAYHGLARRVLKTAGGSQPRWTGEVRMVPEHLSDPLRWKRPRLIFVNSMSDLFHEKLTNEQIAAVFGVMAAAPHHTFQVLTKRAVRMREWFAWAGVQTLDTLHAKAYAALEQAGYNGTVRRGTMWPLPNVWIGVSTEDQATYIERVRELHRVPAVVHFISAEPLLGPIDMSAEYINPAWLQWVIVGCESGHGARPCDVTWIRSLRDQCLAAGVALFVKQAVESLAPDRHGYDVNPDGMIAEPIRFGDGSKIKGRGRGGAIVELPYLDDVQHAAFPVTR